MKKRLSNAKEGLAVDIDWIVSLGIFLIYIGVFFVMIRQLPLQQTFTGALLDNVADGIEDSTKWHVKKLPLVIFSNLSETEPVIVRFAYDWQNVSFRDNMSFDKKDSRLIFIKALVQGKNVLELATSAESYPAPQAVFDLTASENLASVNSQRFSAEFSNALLSRVSHFDKERLTGLSIGIEGVKLNPETATVKANITSLSAAYKLIFPQLNHTSYVVGGYSRLLNYVNTDVKEPHSLKVSATLGNYTFFFINNAVSGALNYTSPGCTNSFGRYIDFYDDISGVTFIGPEGTNLSFCTANSSVRLSIEFQIGNETRYDILFHPGDFNNTLKQVSPYKTAFGIIEDLTGISLKLYRKMNETSYEALKRSWSYPNAREFSFALYNATGSVVFNYQPKAPGITNVFAKELDVFALDKYGTKSKHKLRIKGW